VALINNENTSVNRADEGVIWNIDVPGLHRMSVAWHARKAATRLASI
jgi:hypothetical protein